MGVGKKGRRNWGKGTEILSNTGPKISGLVGCSGLHFEPQPVKLHFTF